MARRLTSFLASQIALSLLPKAALATALLALVGVTGGAWWAIALFCCVAGVLFLTLASERRRIGASYGIAVVVGLSALLLIGTSETIVDRSWLIAGGCAIFFFLFTALLGLVDRVFSHDAAVASTTNTLLLFFSFVLFFVLNQPTFIHLSFLVQVLPLPLFFICSLLLREAVHAAPGSRGGKLWAIAGGYGLVLTELAVITLFLPLGFVNAAVLLALIGTLVRDTLIAHREGILSPTFVLRECAVFVVLAVLTLSLATWSV